MGHVINESDIGWRPFVETWLADREKAELMTQIEAQNLLGLFDKYVDSTAAMTRKGFKKCTPIYLMNQVQTTVYLLEAQFDAAAGVDMTLELMEKIYKDRTIYKKKMLVAKQDYEKTPTKVLEKEIARCNNIQMARKIQLNSAYGAIGNQYFRYYKLVNAEAITLSGQVSIRWIENKMNGFLNKILKTEEVDYVIASDTDSIYLNMGPLVNKFFSGKSGDKNAIVEILDKICEDKLEPFIEQSYTKLADYVQAYEQKMIMKRENIAERGIWTAKKRYILNVWNSEGVQYTEPKLKMMGIEAVKSSTPAPCRGYIKDCLNIIMSGTESDLITYIERTRAEHASLPPEAVAFPRSCNNLNKFKDSTTIYRKSTPIHVRGSLLHNHYLRERGIENKYNIINDGEKIKFCFLKKQYTIAVYFLI